MNTEKIKQLKILLNLLNEIDQKEAEFMDAFNVECYNFYKLDNELCGLHELQYDKNFCGVSSRWELRKKLTLKIKELN